MSPRYWGFGRLASSISLVLQNFVQYLWSCEGTCSTGTGKERRYDSLRRAERALGIVHKAHILPGTQTDGRKEEKTHLIVSDGVTAKIASVMPAPSPATQTINISLSPPSDASPAKKRTQKTPRCRNLALRIRQFTLEVIIGQEPNTRFHRVSNDKRCTSRVEAREAATLDSLFDNGYWAFFLLCPFGRS